MFPLLNSDVVESLFKSYSVEKVKQTLFSMRSFKAPGLDGFMLGSIASFGMLLVIVYCGLALGALNHQVFPSEINETLLVLILKVEDPQCVTQLHMISLYSVAYKVISNAIVIRLRSLLPRLIAPTQYSFVLG